MSPETVPPRARPGPHPVACVRGADVDYAAGLRWQGEAMQAVRERGAEALALIEHRPVYTMGRRGGRASLRTPPEELRASVVDVDRGGDITWHGPGQIVGYPVLGLRARGMAAADYVHALEALLIEVLAAFDVSASVVAGRPGVWVDGAKVAAIGVAIRGGVSRHGFALNVVPDLSWFEDIVPCGIDDASVTSMARLLGHAPSMDAVVTATRRAFEARFDSVLHDAAPAWVDEEAVTA
ncbi:MAG: lipoyl(octanoyl) transferase LipB [Dehalococcoidia bacterium]|nr:lipoyl(octanoyl) transferase LipB [Dehalococcoidia bacterium]